MSWLSCRPTVISTVSQIATQSGLTPSRTTRKVVVFCGFSLPSDGSRPSTHRQIRRSPFEPYFFRRHRNRTPALDDRARAVLRATVVFLAVRDLFVPHVRDVEVWFGFELRGAAARLTAPLHWAIFAFGAWGSGARGRGSYRAARLRLLRGALAPGLERGEPERHGWPIGLAQAARSRCRASCCCARTAHAETAVPRASDRGAGLPLQSGSSRDTCVRPLQSALSAVK